jgi:hypothetical protein
MVGSSHLLTYLTSKHEDTLKIKQRKLDIEERKLELEEKRMNLEKEKWDFSSLMTVIKLVYCIMVAEVR